MGVRRESAPASGRNSPAAEGRERAAPRRRGERTRSDVLVGGRLRHALGGQTPRSGLRLHRGERRGGGVATARRLRGPASRRRPRPRAGSRVGRPRRRRSPRLARSAWSRAPGRGSGNRRHSVGPTRRASGERAIALLGSTDGAIRRRRRPRTTLRTDARPGRHRGLPDDGR